MSSFNKKSNFEDEFEFLVGGNGSGSDDWKTGNNNNRIDKGREISKRKKRIIFCEGFQPSQNIILKPWDFMGFFIIQMYFHALLFI